MALHTPLTTDDDGTLIDARGHEIADLWVIDENGRMRVSDASEAAMRERAAEIVRRCNLHDELVEALRESTDLVPRISGDDPMGPALADWLRNVRSVLAKVEPR